MRSDPIEPTPVQLAPPKTVSLSRPDLRDAVRLLAALLRRASADHAQIVRTRPEVFLRSCRSVPPRAATAPYPTAQVRRHERGPFPPPTVLGRTFVLPRTLPRRPPLRGVLPPPLPPRGDLPPLRDRPESPSVPHRAPRGHDASRPDAPRPPGTHRSLSLGAAEVTGNGWRRPALRGEGFGAESLVPDEDGRRLG